MSQLYECSIACPTTVDDHALTDHSDVHAPCPNEGDTLVYINGKMRARPQEHLDGFIGVTDAPVTDPSTLEFADVFRTFITRADATGPSGATLNWVLPSGESMVEGLVALGFKNLEDGETFQFYVLNQHTTGGSTITLAGAPADGVGTNIGSGGLVVAVSGGFHRITIRFTDVETGDYQFWSETL